MPGSRPTVAGFLWDEGNRNKCEKHGVSIAEIEYVMRGPVAIFPDPQHSSMEQRSIAIGETSGGRRIFVAFMLRKVGNQTLIRPISARYMHKKEIKAYDKARSAIEK
jgi:uncharacterized DUF497 family protein